MPAGEDPDSILRRDVSEWPRLLTQAKPIVAYVIDVATQGINLGEAKEKTAVAQQVIPLIKDIVNPVERDHYWQELARALRTDERALRQMPLPQNRPQPRPSQPSQPTAKLKAAAKKGTNGRVFDMRQMNYVRECLSYPHVVKLVNVKLAQCQQPVVALSEFSVPEDRELIRQMYQRLEQGNIVTITEMCDSLEDDVLQARVKSLLQTSPTSESELSRLPEKLTLSVLHWRLEKVKGRLTELQQLFRETNRNDQPELADLYSQQLRESHLMIQSLNRAADALTAMKDL
jgi:DNA primase